MAYKTKGIIIHTYRNGHSIAKPRNDDSVPFLNLARHPHTTLILTGKSNTTYTLPQEDLQFLKKLHFLYKTLHVMPNGLPNLRIRRQRDLLMQILVSRLTS